MSSETGVPADQQWALLRSDGRALLAAARAAIPGDPHLWEFLREGTPWKEIVESAGEWSADIIVVGTHGRTGVGRLVFGSTAAEDVRKRLSATSPGVSPRALSAPYVAATAAGWWSPSRATSMRPSVMW